MDWKLYTDKYNNRFEHFLSVQIVPVFVQVQKPSLSRGKGLIGLNLAAERERRCDARRRARSA